MTRLAVVAAAAVYCLSLAGLASVSGSPETPPAPADERPAVAVTSIPTDDRARCRLGLGGDSLAVGHAAVVGAGRTA